MTLEDGTEIVHSEMKEDGSVKVYIEKPIMLGFKSVELAYFDEFVHSLAHIIIELSQEGGFDHASSF